MDLTATPPLRFRDVSLTYGAAERPALDGVSFDVGAGEGVALLGANGAGKTTGLRLAMALLQPSAGTVAIGGRSTARLGPEDLAGRAGYLFQRPEDQLFERTVRREVAFGPRQLGWDGGRVDASVDRVLAELGLSGAADTHPYDLPSPLRRLVALAAATVAEPELLLLDEPTAGLDRPTRALVRDVIRARLSAGVAVLAVTHDAEFVVEALHRAVVLEGGRVVAAAPVAAVLGAGMAGAPAWPPYAEVALGLALRTPSLRMADVAVALSERCRAGSSPLS